MISINSFVKKNVLNSNPSNVSTTTIYNNGNGTSKNELDMHYIFGQPFNGTQDVEGELNNVTDINASGIINGNTFNGNTVNSNLVNAETINGNTVIAQEINTDEINADEGNIDYLATVSADIDDLRALEGEINSLFGDEIQYNSGTITNLSSSTINTHDLNVTGSAHFFQLIIDKIKAAGGSVLLTPADGFKVDLVDNSKNYNVVLNIERPDKAESWWNTYDVVGKGTTWTVTAQQSNSVEKNDIITISGISTSGNKRCIYSIVTSKKATSVTARALEPATVKLYWKANHDGKSIANMWQVNDQAICQTFNAATGVSYNVSNKYYWSIVRATGTETINNEDYHYISICCYDYDGVINAEVGDEIAMLGYRGTNDQSRQSAIYIAAYNSLDNGVQAPLIAQYYGINDYDLSSHRQTYFAANGVSIQGTFKDNNGVDIFNYIDTSPRIVTDSESIIIYADTNSCVTGFNDIKGLFSNFAVYLGNEKIPTSEYVYNQQTDAVWYTFVDFGSEFLIKDGTNPYLTEGLILSSMTQNAYDYDVAFRLYDLNGDNKFEVVQQPMWAIHVRFVHDGITYDVSKQIPVTVVTNGVKGEDAEFYRLKPNQKNAIVDRNGTLKVGLAYSIEHIYGNLRQTITATSNGYHLRMFGDNSNTIYNFSNNTDLPSYSNNSFLVNYHQASSKPTYFTVQLLDGNENVLDTDIINVIFDAAASLEITDEITATVQGNYNELSNDIASNTNAISQLNVNVSGISATVEGHTTSISSLTNRVTSTETNVANLTVQANQISSSVSQLQTDMNNVQNDIIDLNNDVDGINNNVNSVTQRVSNIEQTASAITSTVSEHTNTLNNLLVGNRNYFGFSKNIDFQNLIPSIELYGFETYSVSYMRLVNIFEDEFTSGDYIISCDAKTDGATFNYRFTLCGIQNDLVAVNSDWQHYSFKFNILEGNEHFTNGTNGVLTVQHSGGSNRRIYFKNVKIEKANVASQFSISNEDALNFHNEDLVKSWGTNNMSVETVGKETVYTTTVVPTSGQSISYMAKGNISLEANEVYTLYFTAKANYNGVVIRSRITADGYENGTLEPEFIGKNPQSITNVATNLTKIKLTDKWKDYYIHFYFPYNVENDYLHVLGINANDANMNTSAVVNMKNIHLEKGFIESLSNSTSSMIRQTAKDITMQVIGETESMLQLTENNILLQVENCGINIDEQNITLNGNTQVNGNLVLNGENEGFTLSNENGVTQICPQSIGTYNQFINRAYNIINYNNSVVKPKTATQWNFTQNLGNIASGKTITVKAHNVTFRYDNSGTVLQPSTFNAQYNVYLNGNVIKSFNTSSTNVSGNLFNVTTNVSGYVSISVQVNATFTNPNNNILCSLAFTTQIPATSFSLLGYDGFASNFGTDSSVYLGNEGTIIKYADNALKVDRNGVYKLKNNNWVNLSTKNVRFVTSTTSINDTDEFILFNGGSGSILYLPSTTYEGRTIYIKDISAKILTVRCDGHLRKSSSTTPESTMQINNTATFLIFDGTNWNEFDCR